MKGLVEADDDEKQMVLFVLIKATRNPRGYEVRGEMGEPVESGVPPTEYEGEWEGVNGDVHQQRNHPLAFVESHPVRLEDKIRNEMQPN